MTIPERHASPVLRGIKRPHNAEYLIADSPAFVPETPRATLSGKGFHATI